MVELEQRHNFRVCVGICAYDEEKNIGRLLENLTRSNLRIDEIHVIASGCTDKTTEIVRNFMHKNQRVKIELTEESERKGKASATNLLLSKAKGDILLLIAADTFPCKASLFRLIKSFENPLVGAASAHPVTINSPRSVMGSIVHLIWKTHDEIAKFEDAKRTFFHLSGEMCAFRHDLVERIPPRIINEDTYIGWQVKRQSFKVEYVPDAIVYMKGPTNIFDLYKQRVRVVQGHLQIHKMAGPEILTINPLKVPYFVIKCVSLSLRGIFSLIIAAIAEVIAHIAARYKLSKGALEYEWCQVKSTKW